MLSKHLLLASALLATSAATYADNFKCVTFEYPPLESAGTSGKPTGIAVDIVGKVFSKLGHKVDVEVLPWARGLDLVKSGERDCIFTAYRTPEREGFLDFSNEVLAPQAVYLYVKKGSKFKFDGNLELLKPLRVGVVNQISYGSKFEKIKPELKVSEVQSLAQNFMKLTTDRVDVVPSNLYTAIAAFEGEAKNLAPDIEQLPVPVETLPSFIAFTKKKDLKPLRDKFDVELKAMIKNGEYRKVVDGYHIPAAALSFFYAETKTQ